MREDDVPETKELWSDKFYRKPHFLLVVDRPTDGSRTNALIPKNLYRECVVHNPRAVVRTGIRPTPPRKLPRTNPREGIRETKRSPRRAASEHVTPRKWSTEERQRWPAVELVVAIPTEPTKLRHLLGNVSRKERGSRQNNIWQGHHDVWRRRMELTNTMRGFDVHSWKNRYSNYLGRERHAVVKEAEFDARQAGVKEGWMPDTDRRPVQLGMHDKHVVEDGRVQPSHLGPRTLFEFTKEIGYNWDQLESILDIIAIKPKLPTRGTVKFQPLPQIIDQAYGQHIHVREKKLGIQHPLLRSRSSEANLSSTPALTGSKTLLQITYHQDPLSHEADLQPNFQLEGNHLTAEECRTAGQRRPAVWLPLAVDNLEIDP